MSLHDTPLRYGLVTRLLHWGIAALLVWQFGGMVYKEIAGRTPLTKFWVGSHGSVGTLLLVLIVIRVIWALRQRGSRPTYSGGAMGFLAKAGHVGLYTLMLAVPALAVLRMIGGERPIQLFGVPLRGPNPDPVAWMTAPADFLHGNLAWLLLLLVAGHIVMALAHHFVWRDDTLSRMAGRRPPRG